MEGQRLDKLIADSGHWSRKEAKELIRRGRVMVDGVRAKSGDEKIPFGHEVTVDGAPLRNQKHLYIMLHKPAGVLCATRDRDCPTVLDLLPLELQRRGLFPAGRLDKDTEGFVLITDDGEFAHRILSPAHHVPKTYFARLSAPIDGAAVTQAFAAGLPLGGGDRCSPAQLQILENGPAPCVELVIYEGMFHQVKRMFAQFSVEVTYLKRLQIGGLSLDETLAPGESREILHKELARIC